MPWLRERMESRRTKGGTVMRGPIVQSDGRVVACVNCGFEGNEMGASYCGICGACLYNRCANNWCEAVNPPWRRYCGECGAKTRFHEYLRHDEALLYARWLEAGAAQFEDLLESVQSDGERPRRWPVLVLLWRLAMTMCPSRSGGSRAPHPRRADPPELSNPNRTEAGV